jgi:branched-chain amino acid transport system substrate-binding protein
VQESNCTGKETLVMKKTANMDLELGMLRPGIRIKTSPGDYQPIKELFLIQLDGKQAMAAGSAGDE